MKDIFVLCEEKELTDIADAIRRKTNTSKSMTLRDMEKTLNEYEPEDGAEFVDGSIITYENNSWSTINDYLFVDCYSLTAVNFPACTTIKSSACYGCRSLASVSFSP